MIKTKVTEDAKATIPAEVLHALGVHAGDEIAFAIAGDRVVLINPKSSRQDDPFRSFTEWDSDEDRRAYGRL